MITPLFVGVEPERPDGARRSANPVDDHLVDARRRRTAGR
jgi:hypothetical protein